MGGFEFTATLAKLIHDPPELRHLSAQDTGGREVVTNQATVAAERITVASFLRPSACRGCCNGLIGVSGHRTR